jgi:AsmA family protein
MFAAAAMMLVAALPLLVLALDAGYFRPALIHYLQAHFRRQIRIDGDLSLKLWSRQPRIVAERVYIGNPAWVAPGEMAEIARVTLQYGGIFGRGRGLESVTLEDAKLHLSRDAEGRANWQAVDPTTAHGKGIPLIRELLAEGAQVSLDDQRRHIEFEGTVSARGRRQDPPQRLRIEGNGQLNGKPVNLVLDGDPLDSARKDTAYTWQFTEESSGSNVTAHGTLPQPYNFDLVDVAFEASGEDLKDLYYLAGVSLFNTGVYRLSGSVQRRGNDTRFTDLHLRTGQSELEATLAIDAGGERPSCDVEIQAKDLRTADFGLRAAGRAPQTDAPPRFFSDATFAPEALRKMDTQLRFSAGRVEVGRVSLQSLTGRMKIEHGVVTVAPLAARLLQGKVEGRIRADANQDTPPVEATLRFDDLQLSALDHKGGEAPIEGLMHARVDVRGRGRSAHQVAATANGSVSAALPEGMIRESLAEIAGVDLRGIGLTLTHSKREADVRCAVANFTAQEGVLTSRSIVIDTAPVLITGDGRVHLDTEQLDLILRGQPKDLRLLRLDAPLLVRGTLTRPSITVQTRGSPVKLVDPGEGKDVDCATLLAAEP